MIDTPIFLFMYTVNVYTACCTEAKSSLNDKIPSSCCTISECVTARSVFNETDGRCFSH